MTGKTLVFDGDCGMCRGAAALLVRTRLVAPNACRSTHELEPDELAWLRREGLNNEMIILGPAGELRRGADGIRWILGDGWGAPFAVIAGLPIVRTATTFAYHVVSYNRRAIAPPKPRGIRCDCDPDPHAGYQFVFTLLCALFAGAVAAALRGELERASDASVTTVEALLRFGGAFAILGLAALTRGEAGRRYVPHLAATAAAAAVPLLPSALLGARVSAGASETLLLAGGGLALVLAAFAHGRHLAFLGMGWAWQLALLVLVPAAGLAFAGIG